VQATLNVTDPAGQLQWLNATLAAARAANQTVYIAAQYVSIRARVTCYLGDLLFH
jgi:hypothetical protein